MTTQPEVSADKPVAVGNIIMGKNKGTSMSLALVDVKRHVLAAGGSGSGKSWALKVLVEALLAREIPALVFDTMGDITGLALPAGSEADYQRYDLPVPVPRPTDEGWALGARIASVLARSTYPRILTPCSSVGEQVAIAPLTSRPDGYERLLAADGGKEDLVLQADAQAANFLSRVGVKIDRRASAPPSYDLGLVTETLLECWRDNVNLSGLDGLQAFGKVLLQKEEVGPKDTISKGLKAMALGREALWYQGQDLNFDRLLAAPNGKTPIIVVNLCQVAPTDRPWVVAQVLHRAMNWATSKGSSPARPRLAVLLDELAGDPSNVLLPPGTIRNHPSSEALKRCLRQGRHFGLTMLCGTQSAGDIDYKSFSQFGVRIIGRLATRADVDKCVFGLNGQGAVRLADIMVKATPGQLFVVPPDGNWECVRMRQLGCVHANITRDDLSRFYAMGVLTKHGHGQGPSRNDRCRAQLEAVLNEYADSLTLDVQQHLRQAIHAMSA